MLSTLSDVVSDPRHDSVEYKLLRLDVQLLTGDDVDELVDRQQHELFTLHHLQSNTNNVTTTSMHN